MRAKKNPIGGQDVEAPADDNESGSVVATRWKLENTMASTTGRTTSTPRMTLTPMSRKRKVPHVLDCLDPREPLPPTPPVWRSRWRLQCGVRAGASGVSFPLAHHCGVRSGASGVAFPAAFPVWHSRSSVETTNDESSFGEDFLRFRVLEDGGNPTHPERALSQIL